MMLDSSDDSDDNMSAACKWWLISSLSNREFGSHPINRARHELGEYHHLFKQLKQYPVKFQKYMRMTPETFTYICENIGLKLEDSTKYCNLHVNPILAEEQIVITIR